MFAFLGTPDPIAFEIFGRPVRWYAIMLCLGILCGFALFIKRGKKLGLDENKLYDIFLVMIPSAVIGARLYFVLFYDLEYYLANPQEILAVWKGGLAIHGGILFGMLSAYLVCRHHKLNILQIFDLLSPSLALGQAIGRWGNYFNQEAHGTETTLPWAISVYQQGVGYIKVHPTFLYESLWDFLVLLLLIFLISKKTKNYGEVTCWYFILYSIGRFFIEGLRTDSLYFLGMRQAQLLSLALIVCSSVILFVIHKKAEKEKIK